MTIPRKLQNDLGDWKAIKLCHSERSEESQFVLKEQTTGDGQRCFATLNMTEELALAWALRAGYVVPAECVHNSLTQIRK